MTIGSADLALAPARPAAVIHPVWVRITHWINVVALFVMITSGWRVYNASPLFKFEFPQAISLGDGLADALLWHFAAMWLFVVNGAVYVTLGIVTGRFRRKLLPVRPGEIVHDLRAALTGKLSHDDLSVYNAVQRCSISASSSPASSSCSPGSRSGSQCSSNI
jgi:thiosulfate reductase cytochrome b subunit